MDIKLIRKLNVTYEICSNEELLESTIKTIVQRLDKEDPEALSDALDRCQEEIDGHLSLAAILIRIKKSKAER